MKPGKGKPRRAILALDDGAAFAGESIGYAGESVGEVVFNTCMAGYQEILTDPSYKGQMVAMTYPLIGNYGVNAMDVESGSVHVEGFIVKELSRRVSNYRATGDLDGYLRRHRIVGIAGIDTRRLTRHLRTHGARMGVISCKESNTRRLAAKAKAAPSLAGRDLVREVTCSKVHEWTDPVPDVFGERKAGPPPAGPKVVAIDCGIKRNILRSLVSHGCSVTVVPAGTNAAAIAALNPAGVVVSNGPGDPEGVPVVIQTVRDLLGKVPLFGICLGHQILCLAVGGRTFKLKFGHHGGNHPVMHMPSGRVEITSQNHNYAADPDSLPSKVKVTHVNLNDRTVEGMECESLGFSSVQYHPEASPGPHDAQGNFMHFLRLIKDFRKGAS